VEPRKASEVLLDLETKIDTLLAIVRGLDTIVKNLSNKFNALQAQTVQNVQAPNMPRIEAVNTVQFPQYQSQESEKQVPVSMESALPLETSPNGFRRTSRPETYSGDNSSPNRSEAPKPPPGRETSVTIPKEATNKTPQVPVQKNTARALTQNAVPVMQRIVDKGGKSVFLADVEISNIDTGAPVFKTRTNGTGKWMSSLGVGNYHVVIRKSESLTKEKVEVAQDIYVDGTTSPLELKTMIIK
jgi:hypothetical protein